MYWYIVPAAGMLAVWVYFFFFARRSVLILGSGPLRRIAWLPALLVSAAVMIPAFNIWGRFSMWSLFVLHLCMFMLLTQLVFAVFRIVPADRPKSAVSVIYRTCCIPVALTALVLAAGAYNMKNIVRTEYSLSTADDMPDGGIRIALLADIHYGTTVDADALTELTERVFSENADVVVLCGDIVDESTTTDELYEALAILGSVEAKRGVYFVFGNHDMSRSGGSEYTCGELYEAMELAGVTVLEDEAVRVADGVWLIGRKDARTPRKTIAELTEGLSGFIIAADHQPLEFKEKAAAGVDMQLSGHTHGGQIFPIGLISRLTGIHDLTYGAERVDGMTAIVTSGVSGWGFPIRTESHSEYVIIDVTESEG